MSTNLVLIIPGFAVVVLLICFRVHRRLVCLVVSPEKTQGSKKGFQQERRQSVRRETTLRVNYWMEEGSGVGWIKNIGYGGACLHTIMPIEEDAEPELEIDLPFDSRSIVTRAKTVWRRADMSGLVFLDPKTEDLERIFEFIDNRNKFAESVV